MSKEKDASPDNHPVFIQPSTENHGGSNPAVGCFGYTHGGENPTPGANLEPIGDTSIRLLDA